MLSNQKRFELSAPSSKTDKFYYWKMWEPFFGKEKIGYISDWSA